MHAVEPTMLSLYLAVPSANLTARAGELITAAEAACGHQSRELRGLGFERLFSTGTPAGGVEAVLRIARRNGRFSGTGWFTPKDGSRAQMNLTVEPLRSTERGTEGIAAWCST